MQSGLAILCVLVGVIASTDSASAQDRSTEPVDQLASEIEANFADYIAPLIETHCIRCHGESRSKAGVRLDELSTIKSILAVSPDLVIAREMVSTSQMPPEDEPQPTQHERLVIMQWLDKALAYTPPRGEIDPGWFTIHRLNREEYRNTLRDLLGIDPEVHDLAAGLPPDDVGYGYDNIADVLTVSPLHLDAYLDAAERAVEIALGPEVVVGDTPRPVAPIVRNGSGRPLRGGGQYFSTNGSLSAILDIPAGGQYELGVYAWGQQAGDELPRLSIRVDGREVASFFVEAQAESNAAQHTITVVLEAGRTEVSANFTNDYWVPEVADRNLAIDVFTIAGPLSSDGIERTQLYTQVFGRGDESRVAAKRFVTDFLPKVFRRPVVTAERQALLGLYSDARAAGHSHERGIRQMMTATLVSPSFLYRSVQNTAPDNPEKIYELSAYELASRLSYFLWSSTPDEQLLALANDGSLLDEQVLLGQVTRMMDSPKSDALIKNFVGQWLLLRNLDAIDIDTQKYPAYSEALRRDMVDEAELFFGDVLRRERNLFDLVDSDDVFINERLADLYGISGVEGDSFRRVSLSNDSSRGGVLTLAATLTVTSNPTRTSPVKRGLFVLENILGTPPPPPPADIPRLEQSAQAIGSQASLREQLSVHLTNPSCKSCHMRMDPIGLAMENFDAIGQWRESYDEAAIDATGVLPGGIEFTGPRELKTVLLNRKGAFREHLAGEIMTYAIGRGLEPFDRPAITQIAAQTQDRDDRLGAMIHGIVLSKTFRTCRGRD